MNFFYECIIKFLASDKILSLIRHVKGILLFCIDRTERNILFNSLEFKKSLRA